MNRLQTATRRLAALVLVAFAAGAITAHADNAPKPPAPRATLAVSSPPLTRVTAVGKFIAE